MKIKNIAAATALLLASLSASRAATITAWDFDSYATNGITYATNNPVPSYGSGYANTLGMTNSYGGTSLPQCDMILTPGASTGVLSVGWRVRGGATFSGAGTPDGWATNSAIGTQGAEFDASTVGYLNVKLSFDLYLTSSGTAKFQVQYTPDGSTWINVSNLTYAAAPSYIHTNSSSAYTVAGAYIYFAGGSTFYTNVVAAFPANAAGNTNFGVRIVNAATFTDDVTPSGAAKPAGNIRFDNVVISGSPIVPITAWDFDSYAQGVMNNSPAPSIGTGTATPLGMSNSYASASLPTCDIVATAGASTGSNAAAWRIRGGGGTYATAGTPNGWSSLAPLESQGAEFDASTAGYTNVSLAFDVYFTTQAPAQLEVQYTVDGSTWTNCSTLAYASNPAYITNNPSTSGDVNTIYGTYFDQTGGQNFYTNLTATFPAAAANNPSFGVRLVNATTGADELNGAGAPYNNSSGNLRFDNVIISGVAMTVVSLLTPPTLTPAANVTVDSNSFAITFPSGNSAWVSAITNIAVGGTNLFVGSVFTNGVTLGSTSITFSMSPAVYKKAGSLAVVVKANGYNSDSTAQIIGLGAPTSLTLTTQVVGPAGNGGTLETQPAFTAVDQYGDVETNLYGTITATVGSGAWTFGTNSGTVIIVTNGVGSFTNLSAANSAAVSGAYISFVATGTGLGSLNGTTTNSATFNLLAPPTAFTAGNLAVEQADQATANSTFSILEINSNTPSQTSPVNVFVVPATGSNALRQSSSGSCGKLALSDDRSLVCFSAGLCGDSTVSDETTENWRGAATFNSAGAYTFQTTYESYGGSTADQARSAVTVDDSTFFMGDKGGVYINNNTTNNAYIPYNTTTYANVRSLKSFGGTVYALQQSGGTDPTSTVLAIVPSISSDSQALFPLEGFPVEPAVLDFYLLRSGNNGTNYDVCYYIDGTNTTSGCIFKYYFTGVVDGNTGQPIWASAGAGWNTPNGGDSLCVATNASGMVDIYYTTGKGGSTSNSVVHVVDSSAWNQPINLIATNTLYTVGAQASLRGIDFAPVSTNSTVTVTPILPIKVTTGSSVFAGTGLSSKFSFGFTNVTGASSALYVYGTTNLALPFSQWVSLGHPVETATAGTYVYTNSPATNGAFFYQVLTNH